MPNRPFPPCSSALPFAGALLVLLVLMVLLGGPTTGWASEMPVGPDGAARDDAPKAAPTAAPTAPSEPPKVVHRVPVPAGFLGNLAYDADSDRLFLVSLGPPSIDWPSSRLIEVDRRTGEVLRSADLPFQGSFGAPTVSGGDILQAIYVRSELYRIDTDAEQFGRVEKWASLPRVTDLGEGVERHRLRFPYLEIQALAAIAGGEAGKERLVLQASGIGELVTVEPGADGSRVVGRARVEQGLSGLARIPGQAIPGRADRLLASLDVEASAVYSKVRGFNARGSENSAVTKRSKSAFHARRHGEIGVRWLLLEASSGRTLASTERVDVGAWAGNLAVLRHFEDSGPFGRLHVLALGPEGILTLEWVP